MLLCTLRMQQSVIEGGLQFRNSLWETLSKSAYIFVRVLLSPSTGTGSREHQPRAGLLDERERLTLKRYKYKQLSKAI